MRYSAFFFETFNATSSKIMQEYANISNFYQHWRKLCKIMHKEARFCLRTTCFLLKNWSNWRFNLWKVCNEWAFLEVPQMDFECVHALLWKPRLFYSWLYVIFEPFQLTFRPFFLWVWCCFGAISWLKWVILGFFSLSLSKFRIFDPFPPFSHLPGFSVFAWRILWATLLCPLAKIFYFLVAVVFRLLFFFFQGSLLVGYWKVR